jgi:hypothetical protein
VIVDSVVIRTMNGHDGIDCGDYKYGTWNKTGDATPNLALCWVGGSTSRK